MRRLLALLCALSAHATAHSWRAFGHVPKDAIGGLLQRWRPQLVAGNILSVRGVEQYTHARVVLEQTCDGAFVGVQDDDTLDLFLYDTAEDHAFRLQACVWSDAEVDRLQQLAALFETFELTYPRETLRIGSMLRAVDRAAFDV